MAGMRDPWNPARYDRFARERSAPLHDLLALIRPIPGGRAVDLGCGTGALTLELHQHVRAGETVGIDSSPAMLERASSLAGNGLRFERGDIGEFAGGSGGLKSEAPATAPGRQAKPSVSPPVDSGSGDGRGRWDLVFSHAALHWVPDHPALFARLAAALAPGGQLAVQMPSNFDHPSHLLAAELAGEEPFRSGLGGYRRLVPVEPPERYAELLDRLGFAEQHVRLQVYGHHLAGPEEVVEWVRGTLLTDYQRRMPAELFERFLAGYRERLLPLLEERRPYFYPFKRLLLWGGMPR
jgi:trans-aconitate 2-methyltransferase